VKNYARLDKYQCPLSKYILHLTNHGSHDYKHMYSDTGDGSLHYTNID